MRNASCVLIRGNVLTVSMMADCSNKAIAVRLVSRNLCPVLLVFVQPTGLCCSLTNEPSSAYSLSRKYIHYYSRSNLYRVNVTRVEVFMATTLKNTVFRECVQSCRTLPTFWSNLLLPQSTPMEEKVSAEKWISYYQTTRCSILEFLFFRKVLLAALHVYVCCNGHAVLNGFCLAVWMWAVNSSLRPCSQCLYCFWFYWENRAN